MNRRSFIKALSCVPFVGLLFRDSDASAVLPDKMGWDGEFLRFNATQDEYTWLSDPDPIAFEGRFSPKDGTWQWRDIEPMKLKPSDSYVKIGMKTR